MEIYVLITKFYKKDVCSYGRKRKESVVEKFATTDSEGKTDERKIGYTECLDVINKLRCI